MNEKPFYPNQNGNSTAQEQPVKREGVGMQPGPDFEAQVDKIAGADCESLYKNLATMPQQIKDIFRHNLKTQSRIDSGDLYAKNAQDLADRALNLLQESNLHPDPQGEGILRNTPDNRPLLREAVMLQSMRSDLVRGYTTALDKMMDDEAQEKLILGQLGS